MELFNQTPPELGNQYEQDRVLRAYLKQRLPAEVLRQVEPELLSLGELSGGELYRLQLADRLNEPQITHWDAWGERIDEIQVTPLWQKAESLAAEYGLVAIAYDSPFGMYARQVQFALAYLFHPSTDVYTCPLAMTDGAARTLLDAGNQPLIERALPHLTSRDPARFWTSGQWMTETSGGSDVGRSLTTARQAEDGTWRLYGRKWFTSATTSQMALALARPEGNPGGGKGLALFYLETRGENGRLNQIQVNRLKDKLGTRKVPTAELILDGTPAVPVQGLSGGVRAIVPMLQLTRTWNSVSAVAFMRRGLALARDYAARRVAFGSLLAEKPLHVDTLAGMQAEMEAAFHLTFYLVELIGLEESGQASATQQSLLRLLTSLVKLTTGRQAVLVASEVLEAFGGAGYVEDTGLPVLLRDSQVLPIWEGTTNVLALDVLRALNGRAAAAALDQRLQECRSKVRHPALLEAVQAADQAVQHAARWLESARTRDRGWAEAGARRLSLTLGRALALALLAEHAQWALDQENDARPLAAARRFQRQGINLLASYDLQESASLANDLPLTLDELAAST
jgi:alkylation response protein AidB-like acyl-CoA dehydrogenase